MTLEETKAYLRLESGDEDALVAGMIASAVAVGEAFLGQALVRRPIVETVTADGRWRRLATPPVVAITGVSDLDGVALPAAAFAVDIDAHGEGWVRASGPGRLRVSYTAGMAASADAVPAAIAQGVSRLAAHLYTHRDDGTAPPAAVTALWRPYRRLRLGCEVRA